MNQREIKRLTSDMMRINDDFFIYGTGSAASELVARIGYFIVKVPYFIDRMERESILGKEVVSLVNVDFTKVKRLIIASESYEEILQVISKYTSLESLHIYLPFRPKADFKDIVGKFTYGINDKTVESKQYLKSVGNFCSINADANIGTLGNHPIDLVTTSNMLWNPMWKMLDQYDQELLDRYNKPIVIENDVWIATNAVVLPGVTIHNGAIVAAGAVVTKDVPPYAIVGGVPAKVIRYRFDSHIINELLKIKWWDWDDEKIKANFELFFDIEKFVKTHSINCN